MKQAPRSSSRHERCEVFDFDEFLLDACPPRVRSQLLHEARLLAAAHGAGGDVVTLEGMATQLSAGQRDAEIPRWRARKLAAALRRVAKGG